MTPAGSWHYSSASPAWPFRTVSRCSSCNTRGAHPVVACPFCPELLRHCKGLDRHLNRIHSILFGTRLHSLAMDVARAGARGWPVQPYKERLDELLRRSDPADFQVAA